MTTPNNSLDSLIVTIEQAANELAADTSAPAEYQKRALSHLTDISQMLDSVYQTAGVDQNTQAIVAQLWDHSLSITQIVSEASGFAAGASQVALVMREQRDDLVNQLKTLLDGIKNIWTTDHPALQNAYDDLMEAHNAAFWESLPYDMASTLGWDHTEAQTLYNAITIDLEETVVDENFDGYSQAQLLSFRADLRQMVNALRDGQYPLPVRTAVSTRGGEGAGGGVDE